MERRPVILNVDDDDAGRYVVSRQLKQAGYDLIEAATGLQGLKLAVEAQPDLILLDVRLPDIDGFEVCRRIRENASTAVTPIIQMSASYIDTSSRVKGLNNGADAYVVEPADPAVLAATINSLLRMKRAEASVRRDAREWRDTFDAIQDGVALFDAEGTAVRNNQAYISLLRTEPERLETAIRNLFESVCLSRKRESIQDVFRGRTLNIKLDPVCNEFDAFDGAVCTISDVSEQVRFEQQLQHSQKLESLGVLAGGIAHDFNNLLTGILGNASLILETLPPDMPEHESAAEILRAGESAADLTRQILAYSGKGSMVTRNLNLSMTILSVRGMIRRLIPKNVQVVFDMAPDLPWIYGDAGQIQQIAMNLIINAAESITAPEGGQISVRTEQVEMEENFEHLGSAPAPGGTYARLTVQDNGCGMDEATQARIFEPFFTTKFTGRGLGLSAVHGILRSHKGHLTLKSKPGEGTTFEVYFPASTVPEPKPQHGDLPAPSTYSGTILVIDDESSIRRLAKSAFEKHGFQVLLAENGRDGVDLFRKSHEEIDLVVLDFAMPVMDGEEALRELRSISTDVPVILSTGYGESSPARNLDKAVFAGVLPKPYTVAELLAASERAMRRRKSA